MRVYRRPLSIGDAGAAIDAWMAAHRVRAAVILAGAGLGLVMVCRQLAAVPDLVLAPRAFLVLFALAFLAYAVGAVVAGPRGDRVTVLVILAVAVAARLVMWPVSPSLSTDAYRYVWDARVAAAGIDPYAHPPVATEVAPLRDERIFPHLNHTTWRTVYPPLAQAFFRAVYRVAPDSVLAMKTALGIAELISLLALATVLVTAHLPLGRLAIYAWNPLVLVEIWGSGHLDALVIAAVTLAAVASARRHDGLAAMFLGVGTLVKLYPAVLFVLLPGRRRPPVALAFAAVVVLGTLATGGFGRWPIGPIRRYVAEEYFNPGLVRSVVHDPTLALGATALWVALAAWRARPGSLAERAVPMVAGFIVLAPNVFPWYVTWLVPFLAISPSVVWIAFTGAVALSYSFFLSEPWGIPLWARLAQLAPVAAAVLLQWRARPTCPATAEPA